MLDARTAKECASLDQFDTSNHGDETLTNPKAASSDQESSRSEESALRRPQKKMMTEDEVVGQAFIFLLAGYETTSSTLGFTCYLLAVHPECQHKVQQEVDQFFSRHVSPPPPSAALRAFSRSVTPPSRVCRSHPTTPTSRS